MPKASRTAHRLSVKPVPISKSSESEAAQKLPEIIQKFMPNGLLNCKIVNCPIVKFNWFLTGNKQWTDDITYR